MAALTRMELSVAYPFMSLAFPLVALVSMPLFGEQFTILKATGTGFIMFGLSFCRDRNGWRENPFNRPGLAGNEWRYISKLWKRCTFQATEHLPKVSGAFGK